MIDAPNLEEFLAASCAEVAPFAPSSLVYAAAGTRRSAALQGLPANSDAYARWTLHQMIASCDLIFRHGVRHIFTILATPGQFAEVGSYRRRLIDWIQRALSGSEAREAFERYPWRARLWTDSSIPELLPLQEAMSAASAGARQVLWCLVIADPSALWQHILARVVAQGVTTQAEAITACYGPDVDPVSLYLGFGKPALGPELLPPFLMGKVQCYWTQRPGYALCEEELRRILYDYAFLRATWQPDKSTRAEAALADRSAWERGPILGLGRRLGPFWYPQHWQMPGEEEENA